MVTGMFQVLIRMDNGDEYAGTFTDDQLAELEHTWTEALRRNVGTEVVTVNLEGLPVTDRAQQVFDVVHLNAAAVSSIGVSS